MINLTKLICLLLPLTIASSQAITVGILDSGVDFSHLQLRPLQFFNIFEFQNGRDSDGNGLIDDFSGWDVIEERNTQFLRSDYPSFNGDFNKYYQIRKKRSLGTSSEEEDNWYQDKRADDEFQQKRSIFRRFIHGTHIGGLAVGAQKNLGQPNHRISLLSVRYLGDATSGRALEPEFAPRPYLNETEAREYILSFISQYLQWQKRKLAFGVKATAPHSRVVNGSFGISHKYALSLVHSFWEAQFGGEASRDSEKAWIESAKQTFLTGLLSITKEVVQLYPEVLFVFSAGNSKQDTDTFLHYPSGVSCDHCLSIGASFGNVEKASFSNFGKNSVSFFAPGVAIESTIPDNQFLPVNGTSQATPQVAFAAASVLERARNYSIPLSASGARQILIDTTDRLESLKDLAAVPGILNLERALTLTKLITQLSYKDALKRSFELIPYTQKRPKLIKGHSAVKLIEADPLLSL